jgi:ribosomal-protein-alanine N-acetyltransferase
MRLRELSAGDAAALHALEVATNAFPWSLQQFSDSFGAGHCGWGVERAGALQGFALFSQILDEATLLNILVCAEAQRQGLARRLLQTALPELSRRGARRCLLEVRVGNAAAIALYRRFGFGVDGRRRDYYPTLDGREDALLMSRDLPFQNLETV